MELLDVNRSIVLVIDLQARTLNSYDRPRMALASTVRLIKIAGLFGVPVIMTEHYPEGLGAVHTDIRAAFDALTTPRHYLAKTFFGCCGDPNFESILTESRPGLKPAERQIVIAGAETHICVMQTVLELLKTRHQVHVCWECVTGRGEEYRRHALDRMAQAGAVITNHESVGFEWVRHKNHPAFKGLNAIIKQGQITE